MITHLPGHAWMKEPVPKCFVVGDHYQQVDTVCINMALQGFTEVFSIKLFGADAVCRVFLFQRFIIVGQG